MGLFSNVLHLKHVTPDTAIPALDTVLATAGFSRCQTQPVPASGPSALLDDELDSGKPCYLLSQLVGEWMTIVEAHGYVPGAPQSADCAAELSRQLNCYALALVVHDGDVFYYTLAKDGRALDRYNSCPQYFENEPLSEDLVQAERHAPEAFIRLLPSGTQLSQLVELLNRGWWKAHDTGKLDEHGVPIEEEAGLGGEEDRMTGIGDLLALHGNLGRYPFTAWRDAPTVDWQSFVLLRYTRAPRIGRLGRWWHRVFG